ncbi:hypothetical protein HYU20_03635 [Candidatus Woesearchaeota archaeon]|nr:hypothetical protein [Candidatus Woesearchaeota archaeon]
MAFTNAAAKEKYFDFDRGIDANANSIVKALGKAHNFIMWFFVRDSWIALVPRWGGTLMLILTLLKLTGVIK